MRHPPKSVAARWKAGGLAAVWLALTPFHALAQSQQDRAAFDAAKSELKTRAKTEQFYFASQRCQSAFAERQRDQTRIWCALASEQAISRVDMNGNGQPAEIDILARAVWLSAIDGLQHQKNPWWGSPRAETVPIKDDLRRMSLLVIADLNRRDMGLMEFNFVRLASLLGAERAKGETLGQLRRKAASKLDAIVAAPEGYKPAAEDVLWAKAALGLSLMLVDRRDDRNAEARQVESMLLGLDQLPVAQSSDNPGLSPALLYAGGVSKFEQGDAEAARVLFRRGSELCVAQVWQGAALCNTLALAQGPG